tara:strand:+ start:883 stop:1764 length:882 start_codon:yes stop_codon:yes gene_type:complete
MIRIELGHVTVTAPTEEALASLYKALAEAQALIEPCPKTGINPHLKNRFSTIGDIRKAIRGPLAKSGLSFLQFAGPINSGENGKIAASVLTQITHEGGGSIVSYGEGPIGGREGIQDLGSSLTYLRRYHCAAALNIDSEPEDDGEDPKKVEQTRKAEAKQKSKQAKPVYPPTKAKPKAKPLPPSPIAEDDKDPEWARERAAFCAAVSEVNRPNGVNWNYEKLAWVLSEMEPPRPRPSRMNSEARSKVLKWLQKGASAEILTAYSEAYDSYEKWSNENAPTKAEAHGDGSKSIF